MSGRLGELLVRENLISLQQLQKAQEEQRKTGGRIGSLLVKQGSIAEADLTSFLSKQYGVPAITLKDFDIDEEVLKLVPKATAEKHQVIPVNRAGSSLIVAMSDPSNIFAIDDVKFLTGYNVEVVVASRAGHPRGDRRATTPRSGRPTTRCMQRASTTEDVESSRRRGRRSTSSTSRRAPRRRRSSSW